MTVLLSAHNVACAAQLEVAHGDFEAAAELGELPDCGKALLLNVGKHLAAPERKVRIGSACAPADPAAQLMEL